MSGVVRWVRRGSSSADDTGRTSPSAAAAEAAGRLGPPIGRPPENRRQMVVKLLWVGIWLLYMGAPVSDLWSGRHTPVAVACGAAALAGFVLVYLGLVFRTMDLHLPWGTYTRLGLLLALAVGLTLALGSPWLVLFVYFSVGAGAALPVAHARWVIALSVALLVLLGATAPHGGSDSDLWQSLIIPGLLSGFAMSGVRRMVNTTRELRETQAVVAHLAAGEERLRLARDLHDLLGHSLSLITLKSELAGRMLPDNPAAAAQQIADIERVSRQALVDVREAVSDYRRPTLQIELAGARTAFLAAGITAELPDPSDIAELHPDQESALAWAVREASTNVVRHSGAGRCSMALTRPDEQTVRLTVTDDGHGAAAPEGNGLTGLRERLALAGGTLETGPCPRGGFALRATVPAAPAAAEPAPADRPVSSPS